MKKCMMTFAIVAVGLLVAACGAKTSIGNQQGTDEVKDASANISGITSTIEHSQFSVGLPNGWQTMPSDDPTYPGTMLFRGGNEMNLADTGFLMFNLEKKEGKSLEESMTEFENESKAKRLKAMTFGDTTWQGFEIKEGEVTGKILVMEQNGYFVTATITKMELDDPDIKAIIQSFKTK